MPTTQGDLALLNDPVAQRLLQSTSPARLAYTWTDGSPRVVPIGFHWNGQEIILGSAPGMPKLKALAADPRVALSIDTNDFPYKVLLIRGTARMETSTTVLPEYVEMSQRMLGPGADAWLAQTQALTPALGGMIRVAITPQWVGILDFEQRFPNALERAVAKVSATPG